LIGQTISRYKILSKLGEGGMGEVYLAEDTELGREVALKLLPPALAEKPERLERFKREARAVAALDHPNIVTIYNVEEAEGRRLLVMERVKGKSLDQLIPGTGLPLDQVFDIAIPMADALAAAHEKGITHRDFKPANVMVNEAGQVKVLDFGLAKLAAEAKEETDEHAETEIAPTAAEPLTGEGVVMGTAPYMSPEQLQGLAVDSRTDVFSLGIVLYEMVTGERPFQGKSGLELASSILKDAPSAVTEIRAELPRHLGRIVQHCLEKDPERRFQSIKDVRNELEALRDEVQSRPVTTASQPVVPAATPPADSSASSVPAPSDVSAPVSDPGSVASGATQIPDSGEGLKRGLAVALLLAVAAGAWWMGRGRQQESSIPTAVASEEGTRSVAVLPFADLSPEQDQEYFTDGMTEELLSALGKTEGLRVPSRTAIFALKDKALSIAEVGERLDVDTVLEGSVRKAGDRLRITTQLVQVSDGFQLWTETYDRQMEDIFAVQDEIAQSIAGALQVTLAPQATASAEVGGTNSPEAYDFYLQGNGYLERLTVDDFEYAVQMYQRAVEIDPDYALAWAALSFVNDMIYVWTSDASSLEAAGQASARALKLAPDLAAAHASRANYHRSMDQNDAADREYAEAIRLDPEDAQIQFAFGQHLFTRGELERAGELWEKAAELDPEDRRTTQMLPQVYMGLGQEEKAKRAYQRAFEVNERHLELNPDDLNTRIHQAANVLGLGRRDEAFEIAQAVLDSGSSEVRLLYNTTCFYSLAGEIDLALEALEKTVDAGYSVPDWVRNDSDLDNIRDDPRFEPLLQRMEKNRLAGQG
jgi:serine/threonine-protein kinase